MELLDELKIYIRALGKVKESCHKEALINDESAANVAMGQYTAYATCQDNLIEMILQYEKESVVSENTAG